MALGNETGVGADQAAPLAETFDEVVPEPPLVDEAAQVVVLDLAGEGMLARLSRAGYLCHSASAGSRTNTSTARSGSMWFWLMKAITVRPSWRSTIATRSSRIVS